MDGDLQDDPEDIPIMLKKLNQGYDFISGWKTKKYRWYNPKYIPSKIFNKLTSILTGIKIHDIEICLNDYFLELFSIFDIKAKENKTPLYLKKGLPDNQSKVFIDSTKLNKVMHNLLENALKFTSTGHIEFGYKLLDNTIEIYVSDTGIGISRDKQNTIFEKFSQAEQEISQKTGITVIVASHDPKVEEAVDLVFEMKDGELVSS